MRKKLIRITTIPLSLEKLLEGQLSFMNEYYEVTAISAEKDRLEKFGKDNKVKTFWVEMTRSITLKKDIAAVWKLYRFLLKEKPLIVHTHTPKAGIVGMLAAKMAGIPIRLHTVAGLPLMETQGIKRKVLNRVEKFTYNLATRVYPNSYGLKKIILDQNFAKNEKLKVLSKGSSNGIDTFYFDPSIFSNEEKNGIRKKLGISETDFVFIFIGRLVSEKGINEMIKAFHLLQKKKPNISLLLVGPFEEDLDPLQPETLKIIKNNPKILTTGYQVDVRPYLAISDVLVFPSYREGFPNVVMQAGAMNLPAIVSDINGCNEIIVNRKTGIIIPVKNMQALKNAMEEIMENNILRQELSKYSRTSICKYYERQDYWQILLKEYKTLEEEVTKG